jgi:hypothetical protein
MKVLLIILLIVILLDCIKIETHFEDTFWIDKYSKRRIKVISDNVDKGILFQYVGEKGLKTCSLITFLKTFKYDGTE